MNRYLKQSPEIGVLPPYSLTLVLALFVYAVFAAGPVRHVGASDFTVTEVADINPGVTTDPEVCTQEVGVPCGPLLVPRQRNGAPNYLTVLGNHLYFSAYDLTGGHLFQSDGVTVAPVGNVPYGRDLTVFQNGVYFSTSSTALGNELARVDANGVTYFDIAPGTASSVPIRFHEFAGNLYFVATGSVGRDLYRTDGTTVSPLADIASNPTPISEPDDFTEFNGWLYFSAEGSPSNLRLYRTDGNGASIVAGSPKSPDRLTPAGNQLYFTGAITTGSDVYRTDGTTTVQVTKPNGTPPVQSVTDLFALNGDVYFRATGSFGTEPYRIHGDSVSLLADIRTNGSSSPTEFMAFKDHFYFAANDGVSRKLFKLDGDVVSSLGENLWLTTSVQGNNFAVYHDELYFAASEKVGTNYIPGLFKTDGDVVTKIADIDISQSLGASFFEFAGQLFFRGPGDGYGTLYRVDANGVRLVASIFPESTSPEHYAALGDSLFFSATGEHGSELFKLSVIAESNLAGDYNDDGVVNAADYTVWRNRVGSQLTLLNETASLGIVDHDDFLAWRDNFGVTAAASGASVDMQAAHGSNVPEPSAILLVVLAANLVVGARIRLLSAAVR